MREKEPKCECGRRLIDGTTRIVHRADRYFTYHRCECGSEWTTVEIDDHRAQDPVTSGEVLAVRDAMKDFEGDLKELLVATHRKDW